jgi:hypothetical protein
LSSFLSLGIKPCNGAWAETEPAINGGSLLASPAKIILAESISQNPFIRLTQGITSDDIGVAV